LAFVGFSLPTFFTGIVCSSWSSAIYLDWLPFVYRSDISRHRLAVLLGAFQAEHHADHGPGPVPGAS
jgi:ABC-type dipeptide/oligopeptide/nickel transport system permease component